MEFAGIHHKLLKQGLFNLNVNWLPLPKGFQPRQSAGGRCQSVDRVGKKRRKAVCRLAEHVSGAGAVEISAHRSRLFL